MRELLRLIRVRATILLDLTLPPLNMRWGPARLCFLIPRRHGRRDQQLRSCFLDRDRHLVPKRHNFALWSMTNPPFRIGNKEQICGCGDCTHDRVRLPRIWERLAVGRRAFNPNCRG
jgi:hypothetical protein